MDRKSLAATWDAIIVQCASGLKRTCYTDAVNARRMTAGMALATLFVTMPFVARELIPILEAMDMAQVGHALYMRHGTSDFHDTRHRAIALRCRGNQRSTRFWVMPAQSRCRGVDL